MTKVETAAQREEKIIGLVKRITKLCSEYYAKANQEQRDEMFKMLTDLENSMVAYRDYEVPWDSVLIDVVEKIDDRQIRAKALSTFDSVMDKARELFVIIGAPDPSTKSKEMK